MRGRKRIPGREGWKTLPRNVPVPPEVYALVTASGMDSYGDAIRYFLVSGMVREGLLKEDNPVLLKSPYPKLGA